MKKIGLEITEDAEADYREAVDFYAADNRDAARRFAGEFRSVIGLLRERPLIGTLYVEGTRKKIFPHFPYGVVYDVQPDQLTVIAILHQSRDPEYWLERVKNRRR